MSTLGTDAQLSLPVTFKTMNFLLMPPNSSGCGVGCGHVHLLVDGSSCNTPSNPYNNEGTASPLSALFAACASPAASHTLSVELHNNDHTPLLDSKGKVVSASVTIQTATGNSGVPSVAITSPAMGASVALGMDINKSVAITFTTMNFTLAAPGTPGCQSGCGHVNILIDDTACDAPGTSYNATGSASPISALFGLCASAAGPHTVTVQLLNSDNSPVTGAINSAINITTH